MRHGLLLDKAGPSEEDKMEQTSNYIADHFNSHTEKKGLHAYCTIQEAVNPQMITPPTQNERAVSPHNPFYLGCRTSYVNIVNHHNPMNDKYVCVTPAKRMDNQAAHVESSQQSSPNECHSTSNKLTQSFFPHHMLTASHSTPTAGHLE